MISQGKCEEMIFQQYLLHMLGKKRLRQIDLLYPLQLSHPTFKGLDVITLSRWCNNKTLPPIKKQLLIAHYFEKDLSYFIQHIDPPRIPSTFLKEYTTVFNKIETSYGRVGYFSINKGPATLSMQNVSTVTHRQLFSDFYGHMETYNRIYAKIDQHNETIYTTAFTIKQGDQIVSHLAFNEDVINLSSHFKQTLPTQPNAKSILINVGYYSCRNYFELLVGHLLNHLVSSYSDYEECYVVTRGKDFLIFLEQLGGTVVLSAQESRFIGNVYLLRFDLKQLLAHPFIFKQIQRTYLNYLELKTHLSIHLPNCC